LNNMSMDLSPFAEAKTDRLTADDLIGGPRTIKITNVTGGVEDGKKQAIYNFEGDEGKPFKPCKTMLRLMMAVWGKYAADHIGKSLTVYRDPDVTFGVLATGGVRISHMSHMDADTNVIVAIKKGKKGAITVKPLIAEVRQMPTEDPAAKWARGFIAKVEQAQTADDLDAVLAQLGKRLDELKAKRPELHLECTHAVDNRRSALAVEGKPEGDMGEAFADDDGF